MIDVKQDNTGIMFPCQQSDDRLEGAMVIAGMTFNVTATFVVDDKDQGLYLLVGNAPQAAGQTLEGTLVRIHEHESDFAGTISVGPTRWKVNVTASPGSHLPILVATLTHMPDENGRADAMPAPTVRQSNTIH